MIGKDSSQHVVSPLFVRGPNVSTCGREGHFLWPTGDCHNIDRALNGPSHPSSTFNTRNGTPDF
jgi:hypothetical protein